MTTTVVTCFSNCNNEQRLGLLAVGRDFVIQIHKNTDTPVGVMTMVFTT